MSRVGARDSDEDPAPKVNRSDCPNAQIHDMGRVTLHKPIEAIIDAKHFDTGQAGANRCSTDNAVDSGRWATASQYCNSLKPIHRGRKRNIKSQTAPSPNRHGNRRQILPWRGVPPLFGAPETRAARGEPESEGSSSL